MINKATAVDSSVLGCLMLATFMCAKEIYSVKMAAKDTRIGVKLRFSRTNKMHKYVFT